MVHRVDHGHQLPGAPAVAQFSEGHCHPDRPVGILPAILPYAGDVSLDVTGIQIRLVEGRVQELDQRLVPVDKALIRRLHGRAHPFDIACT